MTNVRSTTQPAPVLEGYPEPEQQAQRDRMAQQMKKLGHVDKDGFRIATPEPVQEFVEPQAPGGVPNMTDALSAAVAKVPGADLAQLLDSTSFLREIGPISAADSLALIDVVRAHTPAPAAPGMQPDAAQHRIGASVPSPSSGTLLERIQAQTAKHLDQPLPPGSTYRG